GGLQLLSETSADIFISTFKDDIDTTNIKQEIVHFSSYVMQLNLPIISPQNIYIYVHENNLKEVFPNVYISLRLYLTLPVSNCEAERTNSKLELIENTRRTSLHQEKLNSLVRLSAEREITNALDFSDLIQKFSELKSRKKPLS
ncbi:HAT, C-terminal dimerisation domain, partial [Cinara cedri]